MLDISVTTVVHTYWIILHDFIQLLFSRRKQKGNKYSRVLFVLVWNTPKNWSRVADAILHIALTFIVPHIFCNRFQVLSYPLVFLHSCIYKLHTRELSEVGADWLAKYLHWTFTMESTDIACKINLFLRHFVINHRRWLNHQRGVQLMLQKWKISKYFVWWKKKIILERKDWESYLFWQHLPCSTSYKISWSSDQNFQLQFCLWKNSFLFLPIYITFDDHVVNLQYIIREWLSWRFLNELIFDTWSDRKHAKHRD